MNIQYRNSEIECFQHRLEEKLVYVCNFFFFFTSVSACQGHSTALYGLSTDRHKLIPTCRQLIGFTCGHNFTLYEKHTVVKDIPSPTATLEHFNH